MYIFGDPEGRGFDWDEGTARANLERHGVDFADATAVLGDEAALTMRDGLSAVNEARFLTLGKDSLGRILVVAFTWREWNVRLISAREATRIERREYGGGGA